MLIHFVFNTHWDREWYLPFEQFQEKLVQLTDKLLEICKDSNFKYFVFDGQTVVLEDYLSVKPQKENELRKFISAGKILVGPWYIQPDEFLVSGEFLIRNLLLGHKIAKKFGNAMKIGYLPDSFGHISQLPQILMGFGLGNFIFTRGLGDVEPSSEYIWKGPDGTGVIAHYQIKGYDDSVRLIEEEHTSESAYNFIKKTISMIAPHSITSNILINAGGDHCVPTKKLLDFIKLANEKLGEKVINSNYEVYCEKVTRELPKKVPEICGELRGSRYHFILPGVYSSRTYLKQDNFLLQNLFEKWAEPLCVWAFALGDKYPEKEMEEALKIILQNQPHDSICGCSVDRVHRDMKKRSAAALKIVDKIINEKIDYIAKKISSPAGGIVVSNPLGWRRNGIAQVNNAGKISAGFLSQKIGNGKHLVYFEDIPSCGYKVFLPLGDENKKSVDVCARERVIENKFYKVSVNLKGLIDILDKETGISYKNLHHFEDEGDRGDEYNFCPVENDLIINSSEFKHKVELVETGPVRAFLKISYFMRIPEKLNRNRKTRFKNKLVFKIVTFVRLYAGTKRVDFATEIENKAKDHRLRVGFKTGIKSDFHFAESAFDVVKRNNNPPSGIGWREPPSNTHSQQRFLSVYDSTCGISLFNQGLPEYEVRLGKDKSNTILLTLLRCTGWLSRNDLSVRPSHAGPGYETPEAQCIGKHIFNYSLTTYAGSPEKAEVWKEAYNFTTPVKWKMLRVQKGSQPEEASFLEIKPGGIILSAVKKSISDNGIIVRIFNVLNRSIRAKIRILFPVKEAWLCNMAEEEIKFIKTNKDNEISYSLPARKVLTFKFKPLLHGF